MSKAYARRAAHRNPKGDVRSTTIQPVPQDGPQAALLPDGLSPLIYDATECLQVLLTRGDGWVRVTADMDGKNVYCKYKYHRGENRGYYVMAVVTVDQLLWGLQLLVAKTNQVDLGLLRPAKDTAYDA